MAESLGVDFLGYVDLDKRNELLRGALGLILPSVTLEADPLVVSEALSAGTPCIVNSGTASAALSSTSPSVIPYESGGELRVALERLLHEDLKVSARWLYEETWSAGAWTSRYMSLVEEVLRGKTV
jgi:glycosyltransferase involved in cell wall biosynthesis